MKNEWIYIGLLVAFLVLATFILMNQSTSSKFLYNMNKSEEENRKELLIEIEKIKLMRDEIKEEIESIKREIQESEKNLNFNIQTLKTKQNETIRDFSDSSYNAILKQLRTK